VAEDEIDAAVAIVERVLASHVAGS
jgi:hypothetical protein